MQARQLDAEQAVQRDGNELIEQHENRRGEGDGDDRADRQKKSDGGNGEYVSVGHEGTMRGDGRRHQWRDYHPSAILLYGFLSIPLPMRRASSEDPIKDRASTAFRFRSRSRRFSRRVIAEDLDHSAA